MEGIFRTFREQIEDEFDKNSFYESAKARGCSDEFIDKQIDSMPMSDVVRRLCRAIEDSQGFDE